MGQSYRCTRHSFETKMLQSPIDETEISQRVEAEVAKWKREVAFNRAMEENELLKIQVGEQSKQIETLKAKIKELKTTNFDRDNLALAQVIKHLIIQYPNILKKYPGLKDFKGLFGFKIPDQPVQNAKKENPSPEP
ncbi:MAG: hypothetical protein H6581_17555 [Bacteroidia bacterium]|nr:hypothetical protein [Bacteroidia bacterium]